MGQALRNLRKQRNMTQGDVAVALGVTSSQVSRVENGKRTISTHLLDQYARVLGAEAMIIFEVITREST